MSESMEGLFVKTMTRDMNFQSVLLKFQWALHCSVNDIAVQLLFVNVCPLTILSLWQTYCMFLLQVRNIYQ
jgi:hypothetical protein